MNQVDGSFSAMPIPNGIFADTGLPLPSLDTGDIEKLIEVEKNSPLSETLSQRRAVPNEATLGIIGELDPNDLTEAGWGILFAIDADPKIKEALQPLLERRRSQAKDLFRVFDGVDGYRPSDTATKWLARRGVSMQTVDPYQGVPYYILLVGSPEVIPFDFQYTLDIFWAIGRVYFSSLGDYYQYAESVVTYETMATVPHTRQTALFATCHDFDRATQLFATQVAETLSVGESPLGTLGKRQGFALQSFIGETATKTTLANILRGQLEQGPPALLMTGSHGMGFRADDPRLPNTQGALVCQDWPGLGKITADHWFSTEDLPADAHVHGLIWFLFACYGAGCPKMDNFNRFGQIPKQIAPAAMLAKLPQAILAKEGGGALALLGHVDRAWAYSFQSQRGGPQTQGFRDVLGRIMRGDRIGQATDQFNVRWSALSAELAEAIQERRYGVPVENAELANRWVSRDDARNYIIFGDPAVRFRVEEMAPLKSP
jgi:hypothetical protein